MHLFTFQPENTPFPHSLTHTAGITPCPVILHQETCALRNLVAVKLLFGPESTVTNWLRLGNVQAVKQFSSSVCQLVCYIIYLNFLQQFRFLHTVQPQYSSHPMGLLGDNGICHRGVLSPLWYRFTRDSS